MAEGGPEVPQKKEDILKRLDESLECSICIEHYTDPRVLNCQHNFCTTCLKQHVGDSDTITCPLCNEESETPFGGIEGLKSNLFIKGLIEDVIGKKSELANELKVERKCGSCDEGSDAISHCEDCDCDLCAACIDNHKKMKALKDHTVTPLPTEEELLEEMKIKSNAMIETIINDVHDKEAQLNEKISSLRKKIGGIEQSREVEMNKLRQNHRALLVTIHEYTKKLSSKIMNNAAERLRDMPEELAACEQQLKNYKMLKQQGWIINNIQIHKRMERCQEEMKQISDFQLKSQAVVYNGWNKDVKGSKFIASEASKQQMVPDLVLCLGYLTPIPSRYDRAVEIRQERNISDNMKNSLVELIHDALDHIGTYPITIDSLFALSHWMRNHMEMKYAVEMRSMIVGYGPGYTGVLRCKSILIVDIDNINFTLFE